MPAPTSIYQIKVTLNDSKPAIWRRFLVRENITLNRLHEILQVVMGWENYHLHMFTIGGQIFGDPEDDETGEIGTLNEKHYRLNQLVGREGFKFRYEYDFGDSWLHDLVIEKILPVEKKVHYPVCIMGKRACPPEDVGGLGGYDEYLEAMADPEHPDHRQMQAWRGDFDPEHFDLDEINERFRHPRRQRDEEQDFFEPPPAGAETHARIANWSGGLDPKQIALTDSLAVRRDMVTFLSYLKENRVVGTRSTGNLPLKAVREICANFVNPPVLDDKHGDQVFKLRSEDTVWPLFFLHVLADRGRMVTGGQAQTWRLTPLGEAFLNSAAPFQLGFMLDVWWHAVDWRIAFPVSGLTRGLPSDIAGIVLGRLRTLPVGEPVSFVAFADQLIQETRFTWPSHDQDVSKMIRRSAIERMVILPLVDFGCMETEYGPEDIGGHKFSKLSAISLTQLGKGLLETL